MKHPIIRRLALVLALAMLLSMIGLAEDLSLNGLELPEIDMDGLSPEDVFIGDGDALELPDFEGEIELPGVGDDTGAIPEADPDAPELQEDLDGTVDEASAAIESDSMQNDLILIDEEIEQTGGAGDGWQIHGDVPGAEADNDALADAYLRRVLPGFGKGGRTYASPGAGRKRLAKQSLTGSLAIYDAIKPMIEAVAAGERTSTQFTFDSAALGTADHWWTPEDLGVASFDDEGFGDALLRKEGIDDWALVHALLEDCPYHLYWFDKTRGWSIGYMPDSDGSRVRLDSLTLSMTVAEAYAAGTYAVNTLPAYVSQAVSNINTIISDNAAKGDLDKVTAYADVICDYVDYNFPAAYDDSTPYGDPWQLVWIFDGEEDTKVVCEGYAKGFKYLCDLSAFQGNVSCILAEGMMSGGTGEGRHMWNSLKMPDGRCYLVDLTNCDAGYRCSYTLFLKGAVGEAGGPYVCAGLRYEFYDWFKNEYGEDSPWLTYSSADYGKEEVSGDGAVNADWTALQAEINSAANNGKVTLTKDITASDGNMGLEIPEGKSLTLDLAGHTLDRGLKAAKNDGYVLGVSGSLTLVDSVGGGKITGGWTSTYGGGIYVDYGASLTVASGTISGNRAFYGGGVGTPNGTLLISGGKIVNNIGTGQGGGVELESGKLEMIGGEITGNRSANGGGVWIGGTFEMKDGKISDNDAYDPEADCHLECGGGICGYHGNIIISGGEISGNRCNVTGGNGVVYYADGDAVYKTSGGGVYVHYCTLKMTGGVIARNTTTKGGGVTVEDASFEMTGGSICDNTAAEGGGVMLHACLDTDEATFTMKGGEISGNTVNHNGGGVYIEGTTGHNAVLNLDGGNIKNNVAYETGSANDGGGIFCYYGAMRLNGASIKGNKAKDGGGISVARGALEMISGEICGNSSAFIMNGEENQGGGGGIRASYSNVVFSGGSIYGNSAGSGGGIYAVDSVLKMTGGSIRDNNTVSYGDSVSSGGGLSVLFGDYSITDGEITGNQAMMGGGVYIGHSCFNDSPTRFTVSGNVVIKGNTKASGGGSIASNACVGDCSCIGIGGTLDASAYIGVTEEYKDYAPNSCNAITSGLGTGGNIGAFFSDDPKYTVEWTEDGKEACLVKKAEPTAEPTVKPTAAPTAKPTVAPSAKPTVAPSAKPTVAPSAKPTVAPSVKPTASPKVDISKCKLTVKDQTYTGKALKPAVTVKHGKKALKQGTDYAVSYKNNVKPGTATVTVTGKGGYTGSAKVTFKILVPLSKCKVTVKDQAYTGKALKPAVTVKYGSKALKKGTDYTVSYKNNKAVGVATVTVKGKGGYTGTKKVTFTILPRTVAISKLTAGKQRLTVKWVKRAEATGYELQYALKSSFAGAKTVSIKKNATVSATIKKLKTGKTYYVRLRSYKTVGKKTYRSAWSKGKGVKVK